MSDFDNDFSKATNFFINNKDKLEYCLEGNLINIELDNKSLAKTLDRESGIDYFFIDKNKQLFGVSARVNFNLSMHKSVTIRCSRGKGKNKRYNNIEFKKGVDAYKNKKSPVIASLGLQMDADDKKIKEFIIYDRKQLFLYSHENYNEIKDKKLKTVKKDGNTYLYFKYSDFKEMGIWHKIYK